MVRGGIAHGYKKWIEWIRASARGDRSLFTRGVVSNWLRSGKKLILRVLQGGGRGMRYS